MTINDAADLNKITQRLKQGSSTDLVIPLDWVQRAAKLPGKALAVGLIILQLYEKQWESDKVVVGKWIFDTWGIKKGPARRGLIALKKEGLIEFESSVGRHQIVTLLESTKPK